MSTPDKKPLTDDERAALAEALTLVAEEVEVLATMIKTQLIHIAGCAEQTHRALVVRAVAENVSSIMLLMRMVGWSEDTLLGRMIADPVSFLAAAKKDRQARTEWYKEPEGAPRVQYEGAPLITGSEKLLTALFEQNVTGAASTRALTPAEQVEGFDPALVAKVTNVDSGSKQ